MIKINKDKTIMEFGSGDIGFNTYYRTDTEEKGLIFYNQEPRAIGTVADIEANTFVGVGDFPLRMIFTKTESIDVLIEALEELKEMMNPNPYDLGHHFECDICGDMFDIEDMYVSNDGDELCCDCFDDLNFFLNERE